MMQVFKIVQPMKRSKLAHILVAVAGFGLVDCNYEGGDPKVQIGANPHLPELQQYLIPPTSLCTPRGRQDTGCRDRADDGRPAPRG
jgi:hypothetical protein